MNIHALPAPFSFAQIKLAAELQIHDSTCIKYKYVFDSINIKFVNLYDCTQGIIHLTFWRIRVSDISCFPLFGLAAFPPSSIHFLCYYFPSQSGFQSPRALVFSFFLGKGKCWSARPPPLLIRCRRRRVETADASSITTLDRHPLQLRVPRTPPILFHSGCGTLEFST